MVAKGCWSHLANNLFVLRTANRLTQKDVAIKAGTSQHTVSNMENLDTIGTPTLSRVEDVAAVFGMKAWHLLLPWADVRTAKVELIDQLIENFCKSSTEGQANIMRISESEARYALQYEMNASLDRERMAAEPAKDYTH